MVKEPDGTTTLYIGAENWPTPIPLVRKGNSWYFDTMAGKKEILYRRVGRNELSAIRVCQELVAAQKEYYSAPTTTSTPRKSSVRMGSTMAFIGKQPMASRGVRSGRWWRRLSMKVPRARTARRLRTAATISAR